ncbi:hypothetical protein [Variovorax sp. YR266]|uniref:hypothetical protein n=1 Tax=Variovorax sp. YR266 TaxID=1884386 RepID=UPI00115FD7B8|nr:hypothetical protein [Variovorax sp. YR266]
MTQLRSTGRRYWLGGVLIRLEKSEPNQRLKAFLDASFENLPLTASGIRIDDYAIRWPKGVRQARTLGASKKREA